MEWINYEVDIIKSVCLYSGPSYYHRRHDFLGGTEMKCVMIYILYNFCTKNFSF